MKNGMWWTVIGILFVVIILLAWFLFATPAPTGTATGTSTATSTLTGTVVGTSTTTAPLSASVTVTSPAVNATVAKTFTVAGTAPGPWFFEAVFPILVVDESGNVIAQTQGQAQGDWMTTGLVTFTATVSTTGSYTGRANLILKKDNPSDLPQNDDSVSIPIVIQ